MFHQYTTPLVVSSSIAAGAKNVSADGSTFDVVMEEPLLIPSDAFDCSVEVQEATVWWTTPNISAALGNNKFYVEHDASNYVITIIDGLYSANSLSETIERELIELTGEPGLLTISGDDPTQRVNLNFAVVDMQVDFDQPDTPRLLLGFDARLVPLAGLTTAEQHEISDSVAAFNQVDHFLIHSDIVNSGIRVDGKFNRTIVKVSIDVHPGSQIVFRPFVPLKIDANNLIGANLDQLHFWLTDQNGVTTDTSGEIWTVSVIISYSLEKTRKLSVR